MFKQSKDKQHDEWLVPNNKATLHEMITEILQAKRCKTWLTHCVCQVCFTGMVQKWSNCKVELTKETFWAHVPEFARVWVGQD